MAHNSEPDHFLQECRVHMNVLTDLESQIHKISSEYSAFEGKLYKAKHSKYQNINFAYLNYLNSHISMLSDVSQSREWRLKKDEEALRKQIHVITSSSFSKDEKMDALSELNKTLASCQGYDLHVSEIGVLEALMEELSDINKENHATSLCLETVAVLTTFADFKNCKHRDELVNHIISRLGKNKTINTMEFLTQILANYSNIPGNHDPIIQILDTLVQNLQLSKSVTLFQHSIRCIVNLYVKNRDREELKKIDILSLVTSNLESQLKSVKEQALWCLAYLSFNACECFKGKPDLVATLCKITMHSNASKPAHSMAWICLANLVLIEEYSSKIIESVSNIAVEHIVKEAHETIVIGIKSPILYGVVSYIANMLFASNSNTKSIPFIPLIASVSKILDYGDFEVKAQAARILAQLSANKDLHRRIEASHALDSALDALCMGYKNTSLLQVVNHFASNPNFHQKLNHPVTLYTLVKLAVLKTDDNNQIQLIAYNVLDKLQQCGDAQLASRIKSMITLSTPSSKNTTQLH